MNPIFYRSCFRLILSCVAVVMVNASLRNEWVHWNLATLTNQLSYGTNKNNRGIVPIR